MYTEFLLSQYDVSSIYTRSPLSSIAKVIFKPRLTFFFSIAKYQSEAHFSQLDSNLRADYEFTENVELLQVHLIAHCATFIFLLSSVHFLFLASLASCLESSSRLRSSSILLSGSSTFN